MESAMEKFTFCKTRIEKSEMTSGDKFRITLTTNKGIRKRTFIFNDNYLNNSSKEEIMRCLVDDFYIVDNYYGNIKSFMRDYGYEDIHRANEVFNLCHQNHRNLALVLGRKIIEQLREELKDY